MMNDSSSNKDVAAELARIVERSNIGNGVVAFWTPPLLSDGQCYCIYGRSFISDIKNKAAICPDCKLQKAETVEMGNALISIRAEIEDMLIDFDDESCTDPRCIGYEMAREDAVNLINARLSALGLL